jgi:hypothetical protein
MKNVLSFCAALVVVAGFVASASAADSIPASTLSSMGLGGVHQMSDNAGLAIRGKGHFGSTSANVWGSSTADGKSSTSSNGYEAGASHSRSDSSASGNNLSYAGSAYGSLNCVHFHINFAGGSSSAMAK